MAAKSTPKDAQIMAAILKDMGVTDYEPRVVNQMLEFSYRYVTDVLEDAKTYSTHANKKNIDSDDVKLAVQYKLDQSFTNPPPRDLLMDVARHKNSTPLPLIKPYTGPKLPPDRYCLTTPNYRLRSLRKPVQQRQATSLLQSIGGIPRLVVQPGKSGSAIGNSTIALVTRPGSQTATIKTPAKPLVPTPLVRFAPSAVVSTSKVFSATSGGATSQAVAGSMPKRRKIDNDDDYDEL